MRNFLSILIVFLLIKTNSFAQRNRNNFSPGNTSNFTPRANVKIISHDNFENKKEIISKNHIKTEVVYLCTKNDSTPLLFRRFDSTGRLLKESTFADRELTRDDTFMFNDKGQLVRKLSYHYSDKSWNNDVFEYDSAGNEVFHITYDKDSSYVTAERKLYNEKNQLEELRYKLNNADFYLYRKYSYNEMGKLERRESFNRNGESMYSDLYEYDNRGNLISMYLENENGKARSEDRSYNKLNQLIKIQYLSTRTIVSGPVLNLSDGSSRTYSYYPDGTVYQFTGNSYDTKTVERHYYQYY